MKKLINNIVLRAIAAFILLCLPTVNLLAQNPCASTTTQSLCDAATAAFIAASKIITGEANPSFISQVYPWIETASKSNEWKAKIKAGFTTNDASVFLRQHLADDKGIFAGGENDRRWLINNAFWQVYHRKATDEEQKKWQEQVKQQKAWFISIVWIEIANINKNRELRIPIIEKAYLESMGRMPVQHEIDYWKARDEYYGLILDACRNWLYIPSGDTDLRQTVVRAMNNKYGKFKPTADEVTKAIQTKYWKPRSIYSEM